MITNKKRQLIQLSLTSLRDPDSNREPSGYEPDELPIAPSRYFS